MASEVKKSKNGFGEERLATHLVLGLGSVAAGGLTVLLEPDMSVSESLALGTGYLSLFLLALTMLIGPINLLRKRSNPVNIMLRRDVAIWSGIDALIHVVFGFQVFENGQILNYFFKPDEGLQLNLFGLGNYTGLVATIIMVVLLLISNQISLRLLKGKRWKFWQRFTYPLAALALVHTFAYQLFDVRESIFSWAVLGLTFAVLVAQLGGMMLTLSRRQQRLTGQTTQVSIPVPQATRLAIPVAELSRPETVQIARRRFVTVLGACVLGGAVAGSAAGAGLSALVNGQKGTTQAQLIPANPATPTTGPNPNPAQGNGGFGNNNGGFGNNSGGFGNNNGGFGGGRRGGGFGNNSGGTSSQNGNGQSSAPAPAPANGNGQAPASNSGSSAASGGNNVNIIAKASVIPVGQALQFTTPDTGERAFVIHEADGSFKAFSGVCTHRPFDLTFESSQQVLYCPLHGVPFNASTGVPLRSPARSSLQSYKVSLDSQGNLIYQG